MYHDQNFPLLAGTLRVDCASNPPMNKRIVSILAAALILLGNSPLYSAETNTAAASNAASTNSEVADAIHVLVARSMAKLQTQKTTETDFSGILADYDSLLAKHTETNDDRLNILIEKGRLLLTLDDSVKALQVFQQVHTEFPDVALQGNSTDFLAGLKDEADRKQVRDTLTPGATFPDFDGKDLQGNALSLSKFKGKVILVDFWATWCPPCVASVPEVQKVYNKYHDKGFEVVGISLDEEKDALEKFVKQRKLPWPQHFDGARFDGKFAKKYGVNVAPTTYLIGRDGKIINRLAPGDDLEKEVAKAIKG
jgi:peroxiredoxin